MPALSCLESSVKFFERAKMSGMRFLGFNVQYYLITISVMDTLLECEIVLVVYCEEWSRLLGSSKFRSQTKTHMQNLSESFLNISWGTHSCQCPTITVLRMTLVMMTLSRKTIPAWQLNGLSCEGHGDDALSPFPGSLAWTRHSCHCILITETFKNFQKLTRNQ